MAKTKTTKDAAPIEVLPAANADQALVSPDTDKLLDFMKGLARFFGRATELEKLAKERLDVARQLKLKPPTNADEDAKVQVALREAKGVRKQIDEHWGITAVVHGLHRKLTAARERAGLIADEAAGITQQLHNRYVEDAQRKAREEQERLNREAEARAAAERAAELARLEAEAVKAEAQSPTLSDREQRFVDLVFADLNLPSTAARSVGYKDPELQADRLMKSPKIIAAIELKKQAAAIREQATARSAMPLDVEVEIVKPAITRATPGGFDRSTYSAEVFDVDAFMAALLDPRTRMSLGIPADCATFNQVKLNEVARTMKEKMNVWPGVRAKKTTTTV